LGGFDQVRIESGEDICSLPDLDQKLWAALSCPTTGLEFDAHTLALLDTDGDGRIRVPEILTAVRWTCSALRNPGDLIEGGTDLPLDAIDGETEDGRRVLASAKRILANLGKADAAAISAEETADSARIFAGTRFNGDGVVPAAAAGEPVLAKSIEDLMACVGSLPDRSGAEGVNEELCDRFFTAARDFAAWYAEAEADASNVLPLGDKTETAAAAFAAVKAKIDDFFTRARLAGYDPRATAPLNPAEADYGAIALKEISSATAEVAAFPLARVEPDRSLPLTAGVNPAWSSALKELHDRVVIPLLGDRDELTESAWLDLSGRFAAHAAWRSRQRGEEVAPLGIDRVKELLASDVEAQIKALIAEDQAVSEAANAIDEVDRLVHFRQHLYRLLNNFVSLRDFYTPGKTAIFQAGTLYLDGRSCELCVRVESIEAHSALAGLSRTYLAYCDCKRRGGGETMTIVAAFTDGNADNLMVGRNGVFYDRKGNDWDATIVKIIEHPISVSQAFWSPYQRIGRLVSSQIEKFAGAGDKTLDEGASKAIADVSSQPAEGKGAPPAPFDIAKFAGIFAAIGLAVGAIGTAVASVITGFLGLTWWQMPLAFAGLALAISGPSMAMAWLKLRERNLGPILDANGWAVNTLAKINIPFGTTLTGTAQLPQGAERSLRDPFAEKKRPWRFYLFLLLALAALAVLWQRGYLAQWWDRLSELAPHSEVTAAEPAAGKAAGKGSGKE